ncbi:hypothetical protein ACVWZX_004934, partial [Deinococcus sp. UYEF24]
FHTPSATPSEEVVPEVVFPRFASPGFHASRRLSLSLRSAASLGGSEKIQDIS